RADRWLTAAAVRPCTRGARIDASVPTVRFRGKDARSILPGRGQDRDLQLAGWNRARGTHRAHLSLCRTLLFLRTILWLYYLGHAESTGRVALAGANDSRTGLQLVADHCKSHPRRSRQLPAGQRNSQLALARTRPCRQYLDGTDAVPGRLVPRLLLYQWIAR